MKPEPAPILPVTAAEAANYASLDEVEKAIHALTDTDYAKLMLIAKYFCKKRKFSPSVMQAEELLSEAFAKTLAMDKKWNKRVSMVRHLDRAMENISGHLARERNKIVSFPDGLAPKYSEKPEYVSEESGAETLISKEEVQGILKAVFADDTEAAEIFKLRAEGFQSVDIQTKLDMSVLKYEAVARRIRRKIFTYLIKEN